MSKNAPRSGPDAEWNALVEAAFHLHERFATLPPGEDRQDAAREAVLSVLEVFPASLDPVENYPAYAVRRLLLAMVGALEEP